MTRFLRIILDQLPPDVLHRLHVLLRLVRLRRALAARKQRDYVSVQLLENGAPDGEVYRKLLRDPCLVHQVVDALGNPGALVEIDGRKYTVERV